MLTLTAIKADIGSIGGHTKPSQKMLKIARADMEQAIVDKVIIDYDITHTGDDVCLLMTHDQGEDHETIHELAWAVFEHLTEVAQEQYLYGAGQDLLKDAPSGNVRGAGPGAAEIAIDWQENLRDSEPFLVFTADKCGPGVFNFPFWATFTSPMYNAGLMLPKMDKGFKFRIIDMEYAGGDKFIELNAPEDHINLAVLLRDDNRFGVQAIYSRNHPDQKVVSASTDRLHTIAGEYKGKDDPVAIVRVQNIFPAPEEIVSPYLKAHYVAGDARGSHHMPLMPVAINTAVTSSYCIPLVSCMAYSTTPQGELTEGVDVFGNVAWAETRRKAQRKAEEMRDQGFVGAAMLPMQELEYSSMMQPLEQLEGRFELK